MSEEKAKAPARNRHSGRRAGGRHGMAAPEKAISFGPSLRRLLKNLREERTLLIIVLVAGAISVALSVFAPRVLGWATDTIFSGVIGKNMPKGVTREQAIETARARGNDQLADMLGGINFTPGAGIDFSLLGKILLFALCLYVFSGVLSFIQHYLLNRAIQRMIFGMRDRLHRKMDSLPLSFYDKQPHGELLSRMTNDIDNISQSLQQTLGQLIGAVLRLVGVTAMMFVVSWKLALITICVVPVAGVASAFIGKRAQRQFVRMWDATGELNAHVEESYTGHSIITVFGRREQAAKRFAETNDDLCKASLWAQFISGLIQPVNFLIGNINYVLLAVVGGLQVAAGQMPLGNVQAFMQYSRMFTQPITQVASMANLLQSCVASAERVFEVMDADEEAPDGTSDLPNRVCGKVEFVDVHFSYDPEKPLIEGLNLSVDPGQTVAIVGPTGAGKTTLVNLLERFYEPQSGKILLDGVDISSIPREQLRSRIGMVLQDTWLFGGKIADNIAYGKKNASKADVESAADAAYVDRFAATLPDGMDTIIDSEGNNVSAGEKQLVTIARAFISDPDVLILDEATSSVDTRTEVLVQKAMARLRSGRTSFVIAHRLSTIRDADVILVMENGSIVEKGSHDELIAKEGAYWRLYQAQFADEEA